MHTLTDIHMQVTERILCYLKKDSRKGLLFTKSKNIDIEGYSNGDWAVRLKLRDLSQAIVFSWKET